MNIFVKQALAGAIKILVGKESWTKVKDAVAKAATLDISGSEKRAMVYTAVKEQGWHLAGMLLNLAIEIAVFFLAQTATDLAKA